MATENKIRVVVKKVGLESQSLEIVNTLQAKQEIVGGKIEVFSLSDNIDLILNEEGLFEGYEPNLLLPEQHTIVGDVLVCGVSEGDFISLTDIEVKIVKGFLNDHQI